MGIDVTQPRLCWQMKDSRRGASQSTYQILVADSPKKLADDEGNLWDSGRVESSQSIQVVYAGKPLQSRMRCYWKVRIWDADGKATVYSKPAMWTMGLLDSADVKTQWIGPGKPLIHPVTKADNERANVDFEGCDWIWHDEPGIDPTKAAKTGSKFFRKDIELPNDRRIISAQFLLAGDDDAFLYINGKRIVEVGGFNVNNKHVADITVLLEKGRNQIAVEVRNRGKKPNPAGLIGKLVVRFDRGEPMVFPTDATWFSSANSSGVWQTLEIEKPRWKQAAAIAKNGSKPWGKLTTKKALVRGCPQIRKQFGIKGQIRRATIYASALGLYKLHINGQPVGDDYFTPGWTDYNKRVYYNTYDVTELIQPDGENAIGAELAAGWYSGPIGWKKDGNYYGKLCKLFAQLEIEMADGTIKTVCTDPSWRYKYGPRIEGEIQAGETFDARLETPGWDEPDFDDNGWKPVVADGSIPGKFESYMNVPVRATGTPANSKGDPTAAGQVRFRFGTKLCGHRASQSQRS